LGNDKNYSKEVRLREEAEAPFQKVRFFIYSALLGGSLISLLVCAARIAAGLNGINTDLLDESLRNAVIDVCGIIILSFLLKNDFDAQESRLKRASKGAELASLTVKGKASFFSDQNQGYKTLKLSSFRTGRGIDKRPVICVAGHEKISEVVSDLMDTPLQEALISNDLVVIPVEIPDSKAPEGISDDLIKCDLIAIPSVTGSVWKAFVDEEASEALKQGVDVKNEGFAIILKKNGRIGQRTSGINLRKMVGEVQDRKGSGMDVTNI
jgi:hypothetical protein